MKKIIAVLLSIQLVVLSAQPGLAQLLPGRAAQTFTRATRSTAREIRLNQRPLPLDKVLLANMRLPLATQYTGLLHTQQVTPAQILAHPNGPERALLLRTDFVALSLQHQTPLTDKDQALRFYRANLASTVSVNTPAQTVADVASLGVLGTAAADAPLILRTALAAKGTPQEALVTTAAAHALLRLEAYAQLEQLAQTSAILPQLWEGIIHYAQVNRLPLTLPDLARRNVPLGDIEEVLSYGPLNRVAADPAVEATFLYMNAGKTESAGQLPPARTVLKNTPLPDEEAAPVAGTETREEFPVSADLLNSAVANPLYATVSAQAAEAQRRQHEETVNAFLAEHGPVKLPARNQPLLGKAKQYVSRLLPASADETQFSQRVALYLTAFSIGLEIGTPIMASIKSALNLPLSYAILVTAATYSPYLFGSFIANWLKGKIGRKGIINAGLGLMGGSFTLAATALGLDGSFTAWDNPSAQYLGLLATLTVASTGAVFIHNAAGPVMTEISQKANALVRQQRGTYIELSRSIGMMASFAFPFIATRLLGLDWSAPFILALPVVGASALALNWAKLPNTKLNGQAAPLVQTPNGKLRSSNSYLHLLREAPGVGSFISGLFLMNAVEVALNSGFLFMLPQLTGNESQRYLLGMIQYSVAFLAGRILAKPFLKWFPKRSISVATLMAAASGLAALGLTGNLYALTAALCAAEVGISTAFTLAYARTATDHKTQDRITSLIMASAISCAIGPVLLTQIAQGLMNLGLFNETGATVATLIGLPTALSLLSAKLFRRMENKTIPGLSGKPGLLKTWWQKWRMRPQGNKHS